MLDPDDVAANRAGRLSEAQLQRLNTAIAGNQGCVALFILPIAVVFGCVALSMLAEG
ncbi:MAG: hypothetical protein NZL98_11205 [Anaerolineales bacterium]|nr:hypothetical protein [Anaerolineales bacterium]